MGALTAARLFASILRGCLLLPASGYAKYPRGAQAINRKWWTSHETPPLPRLLRCMTAGTTEPLSNGGWSGRGILRNAPPAWSGQLPYGASLHLSHFLLKSVALVFAGINPAKRQFFRLGYDPEHETHLRAVARTFCSLIAMQEDTTHETRNH